MKQQEWMIYAHAESAFHGVDDQAADPKSNPDCHVLALDLPIVRVLLRAVLRLCPV